MMSESGNTLRVEQVSNQQSKLLSNLLKNVSEQSIVYVQQLITINLNQ